MKGYWGSCGILWRLFYVIYGYDIWEEGGIWDNVLPCSFLEIKLIDGYLLDIISVGDFNSYWVILTLD